MESSRSFAERLYQLRTAAKLSQEDVAEKIGVSQAVISKWELGETSPCVPQIVGLCTLLDVEPAYLLGMSDSTHALRDSDWLIAEPAPATWVRPYAEPLTDIEREDGWVPEGKSDPIPAKKPDPPRPTRATALKP